MAKPTPCKRILLILYFLLICNLSFAQTDSAKYLFDKGYRFLSVDRTLAIDYLSQCISKDSTFTQAYFHRGVCFFKNSDYKLALDDFEKAHNLNPKLSVIWMYKGFTYRNMGKTDLALNSFSQYITKNPTDTTAYSYILRGKMKYELGDFQGAVGDYDMAIKLKPFEEKYHYYKFVALYDNGSYTKALKAVNKLTAVNPDFYGYYLYKGNVYKKLNQLDSAIYMYSISIIKNYNNADGYFYRAQTYKQKGAHHKALEDFNTAIELNPKDGSYYFQRGECKLEQDDKSGACEDWVKAGELGYDKNLDRVMKLCE